MSMSAEVQSGSFKNCTQEKIDTSNLFDPGKGTFEIDTESWIKYGNNLMTRDTVNPHSGSGCLKIEYVDNANGAFLHFRNSYDLSTNLTIGVWYNVKCWARVNTGLVVIRADGAGGVNDSKNITETNWTYIDLTFQAGDPTGCYLIPYSMSAGEIIWLDDITIQEIQLIPMGDSYVECTTNGCFSFPQNKAFGTWEFEIYYPSAGGFGWVDIVSDRATGINMNLGNGYSLLFHSTDIWFRRNSVGSNSDLIVVGAGVLNDWYTFKITRTLDGEFKVYLNDVLKGTAIDTTHTTSQFSCYNAGVADHRIRNFKHRLGVEQ